MNESAGQFYVDMGRVIRDRRRKVGFSQAMLASHLGVDRTTVLKWEAGRQTVAAHLAVEVAVTLGLTLARLMGGPSKPVSADAARKAGAV